MTAETVSGFTEKGLNIKPPFIEPTDVDLTRGFHSYNRTPDSSQPPKIQKRLQERDDWDDYWKLRQLNAKNNWWYAPAYYVSRYAVDKPVTFFREKIVEPLHDRYKRPYYHRKFNRVPEIDQCGVNDRGCIYEAAEQFRHDKLVDYAILKELMQRVSNCTTHNTAFRQTQLEQCVKLTDAWQEADLNYFIKYGEIGAGGDVMDTYMKQKHRMIWERRHPEIMAERQKRYEIHKQRVANGDIDFDFYKKGLYWQDKKQYRGVYEPDYAKSPIEGNQPLSRDWAYYKKLSEDPEFDKKEGVTAKNIYHTAHGTVS